MITFLNNPLFLIPFIIWTLAWKGIALWKSARRNELGWFLALLILNTIGILEIIYIFFITKKKEAGALNGEQADEVFKKRIV